MFESFFPKPKAFFLSGIIVGILSMIIWYNFGREIGDSLNLPWAPEGSEPEVTWKFFFTNNYLTFYIYFLVVSLGFGAFWVFRSDNPWRNWSVWGTLFIIFTIWFTVQTSVYLNYWNRDFYNSIQTALTDGNAAGITAADFYSKIFLFLTVAFYFSFVVIFKSFFVNHYVFRWRTAMNDYYVSKWAKVRHIEGASQRIQEDTMRFANIVESLGVSAIDAVITLFAFLPILYTLSASVEGLPIIGDIPGALMWAAVLWSLFGTIMVYVVGLRLPGLEFKNQRVEAAYRKELVYGEDDETRAQPQTLRELFGDVRKNYFRLYWNYSYFNFARTLYLNSDSMFSYIILVPTLVVAKITFGVFQQIRQAFGQVTDSFQYIYRIWPTVIELISIRKRLVAFEAAIDGKALPDIDEEYLAEHGQ